MPWDPTAPGSTSQGDDQYLPPSGNIDFGFTSTTGVIMRSPNGNKWRLAVDNAGALTVVSVP